MSYRLTKSTLNKIISIGIEKFIDEYKGDEELPEEYILPYNKIIIESLWKGIVVSFNYNETTIATMGPMNVSFNKGDQLIIDKLEGKLKFTLEL
jgi:hypothetical protein